MIELRGAVKRFGAAASVGPLDLAPRPGRTTVLIGPSGCGKSTVLRLMLGLLAPDAGEVLVDGRPVGPRDWLAVRRRLGYVIQDGGLFPHLTARGNASLVARLLGWEAARTQRRAAELAALLRLPAGALDRYPVQLSGGQRQRVGLLRALFLDGEMLLLDEPLGALDPLVRAELQEELRELFRMLGKTVVLVTHDLAEAGFLGDEVVLLREGRIVQRGGFEDLVLRPVDPFVERFVNAQRSLPVLARGAGPAALPGSPRPRVGEEPA
jgi:osmoprotectant transport system ATP-binding protein